MTFQQYFIILGAASLIGGYFQEKNKRSTIGLLATLAAVALIIMCIVEKYWIGILWTALVWLGAVIIGAVIYNITHGTAGMTREQMTVEDVIKHNASAELWNAYLVDKKLKTFSSIDELQGHYIKELAIETRKADG